MSKIRYGMIGGGRGAFIGGVHRIASRLDDEFELVCGALSSTSKKSILSGFDLGLPRARCYGTFEQMIKAEALLPENERMQVVVVVTPNHMHFPAAKKALEAGFHVLSDKPATLNLKQAKELAKIVKKTGKLYGVTYNYTGYPLIRQARQMIEEGKLGEIRKVVVEYPQGWLATMLENTGQKQASWRVKPKLAGAGTMGDIGTHAANLAEYVTGLCIKEVAADLTIFLGKEGRRLEDDGNVLLRFDNGAKGVLHASQISVGCENNLTLRVYGENGGIEWSQLEPNSMVVTRLGQPRQIYRTGEDYLGSAAAAATRTPAGHPEGYLEAFANIYRNFANHVRALMSGGKVNPLDMDYPTIEEAVAGMAFIEAAVASSKANAVWRRPNCKRAPRQKYPAVKVLMRKK